MISLPKHTSDFSKTKFWDKFFENLGDKNFEWYADYKDFSNILFDCIVKTDKILIIGCGNSNLSNSLYKEGYVNIINIDSSKKVIKSCSEKNKKLGYDMDFINMDVLNMKFAENDFNVVFDKGTLDALANNASSKTYKTLSKMWSEICRVLFKVPLDTYGKQFKIEEQSLNKFGRYICVSLAQGHILDMIRSYFFNIKPDKNKYIHISILKVFCIEKKDELFPIFIFSFFMKQLSETDNKTTFEAFDKYENTKIDNTKEIIQFETYEQILKWIKYKQSIYSMMKKDHFEKLSINHNNDIKFDLYTDEKDAFPRYRFFLVKCPTENVIDDDNHKFAAFIVPLGREGEWLFNTVKGRLALAKSSGFKRLIVIHLNRNHDYKEFEAIKSELSPAINDYRPDDLGPNEVIPFLSLGSDSLERKVIEKGLTSHNNCQYSVEDIKLSDTWYRRLYFLNSPSLIQSEIQLDDNTMEPNVYLPLTFENHKAMITALALDYHFDIYDDHDSNKPEKSEGLYRVLIIGLGGGILPNFMFHCLPDMNIQICEVDLKVSEVAHRLFGFNEIYDNSDKNSKMEVHVCDGLDYLKNLGNTDSAEKFNAIILDVNSMDPIEGLFSPPLSFIEPKNLALIKDGLKKNGILISTLLTRDADEKLKVENAFKTIFFSSDPKHSLRAREIDLGEEELAKIILVRPEIKDGLSKDAMTKAYDHIVNEIKNAIIDGKNASLKLLSNIGTSQQLLMDPLDYLIPFETYAESRSIF
ncbi:unnamed protein product [Gordionus sp. m RMFG-2023]|uniref:eEF1A lysine and N-terminal methyltransferase-like n=1 Tax=Gordionus sp. m RMFG-2023 TaxID=3053472 RepID=UPI0030DDF457